MTAKNSDSLWPVLRIAISIIFAFFVCQAAAADPSGVNQLPRVEIFEPTDGSVFPALSDIAIDVLARDADGYVTKVEFFAGTNRIGVDERTFIIPPPPGEVQKFSMVWSNVPSGEYKLTAKATDNRGGMTTSEGVRILVIERTRVPIVTIEAIDNTATEQPLVIAAVPDTGLFLVKRTGETNRPLVIFYSVSGTASNGIDYRRLSGEVTIPAGSESARIILEALDDNLVEGTETVLLALEKPDCPVVDATASSPVVRGCYIVGDPGRALGYIRDNDLPPNRPPEVALISPPDGSVFEAPADIWLIAKAADSDGYVATVEFFEGTNSLGVVTNRPWILDPIRPIDGTASVNADRAMIFPDDELNVLRPIPINPFRLLRDDVKPGRYVLTAVATDDDGASTRSDAVEIKVVEGPGQPIVTVGARDPKASEGPLATDPGTVAPDPAVFVVKRTGPTNNALKVFYRLGGTALNGVDYEELPNSVEIPAGSHHAPVVVKPIDDSLVEPTETIVIALVEPACIAVFPPPPDCYLVGRNHSARAAIYDNDGPKNEPPHVRIIAPEDGQTFLAPADIEIHAKAADTDGFVRTVEFFEGTNSLGIVSNNVSSASNDAQLFGLKWLNVPPGRYVLTVVATDNRGEKAESAPIEIKVVERHEPAVVNIIARDPEAREISPLLDIPENPALFVVTRSGGETNRPLAVHYRIGGTASNGVDYARLPGTVTIPANALSAEILVEVIDDRLCEGDESVILSLVPGPCISVFPPTGNCYRVGTNRVARAVIHDDEVCNNLPPKVAIVRPQDGDVFTTPADIRICAEAKDGDGRVVEVEFFEGVNSIGVVPGNSANDELFCLLWSNVRPGAYVLAAVATDDDGASMRSEPVHIKVVEGPTRPIVSIRAVDSVAAEGGGNGAFEISRSCCTNGPLTVFYSVSGSASNGVDYPRLDGDVIIPRGSFSTRLVVNAIDDNLVEGTETVLARIEPPACIAIFPPPPDCYIVGHENRDVVYIRDNDSGPNIPPHIAILMPDEGQTFQAPANVEILAVGFDPDGWITQIEFFEGTNQIGGLAILVAEPPPPGELQTFHFNWNDVPPGNYTLTVKATDNRGASTVSGEIHIRVLDPCRLPVVTIIATDSVGSEQDPRSAAPFIDTALFRVHRSCRLEEPLLVRYRVSGTASNGVDYERLTGHVIIPAGESSAPILVTPIDDDLAEGTETVVIELVSSCLANTDPIAADCYLVGRPNRAVAYIRDNDSHIPRVAITSPHNGAKFSAPADIPVIAQALDPDGWVTQVEFFANGTSIGVVTMNFIVEPPPGQLQKFELRWNDVPAGHYVLTAQATDNSGETAWSERVEIDVVAPPTIPTVTIVASDPYAREGTSNTAMFRVRRDCCTSNSLMVWYSISGSASNGVDYETISGSVTIPAGARSAPIVITPNDDRVQEPIETVVLQLQQPPTGSPILTYHIGKPDAAAAIIVDNDRPTPISQRLVDGLVHLCVPAVDGECYRIEASIDLVNWEVLCRNTARGNALQFVEPRGRDLPRRFYRVVPDICDEED